MTALLNQLLKQSYRVVCEVCVAVVTVVPEEENDNIDKGSSSNFQKAYLSTMHNHTALFCKWKR